MTPLDLVLRLVLGTFLMLGASVSLWLMIKHWLPGAAP